MAANGEQLQSTFNLFFLIRKLPPVFQAAIIATVILVSATREIAP